MADETQSELLEMTAEIVAAYVSNHSVTVKEIATLIKSVHLTLATLDHPVEESSPETPKATPAQIRKSISDAGLISFEDGKAYKTLKRHLTLRGMHMGDYKAKWGLPSDYPSTAPAYSAARSAMAKSIGLGRKLGEKAPKKAGGAKKPVGRPRKSLIEV